MGSRGEGMEEGSIEPGTRTTMVNSALGTSSNSPVVEGLLEYKAKSVSPPGVGSGTLKMSSGQLLVVVL